MNNNWPQRNGGDNNEDDEDSNEEEIHFLFDYHICGSEGDR